jgi:molecular chaperone DnaK
LKLKILVNNNIFIEYKENVKMSKILGIDLGTTNSCMAIMEGNKPIVILNNEGLKTTPSVVSFILAGERKVGASARRQAIANPENTISSIKRLMGESYDTVEKEIDRIPYKIIKSGNNTPRISISEELYSPQEISAMILQEMKKTAEDFLGHEIKEAIITVPAYFNDSQRKATRDAGEIAGLTIRRIINEPTAAALAYGLDKRHSDIKVAVFDLGGGTFDISILSLGNGVFEVKSTNGNTHLGGDDFDRVIIDWLVDEFHKDQDVDLFLDPTTLQRLKEAAEKAKIELSSSFETDISLPYIMSINGIPRHLARKLNREKFEELIDSLLQSTIAPCQLALKNARMKISDLDEIILVGGSTRIPAVQKMVSNFFGKEPSKDVDPDQVVAIGAAILGGVLSGEVKDALLFDITPLSLGIETRGGVMTRLIEANTTIPTRQSEIFSTAEDNQSSVEIHVLQGERPMADHNKSIGRFHFDEIPLLSRGIPKIEVTFDIDASGILQVTAVDQLTEKSQQIRLEASSGLSREEILRVKNKARQYAVEDQERKEKVEQNNKVDIQISQTEKQLKEFGSSLPKEIRNAIEKALDELKIVHLDQNFNDIDKATLALSVACRAAEGK